MGPEFLYVICSVGSDWFWWSSGSGTCIYIYVCVSLFIIYYNTYIDF